jgi:hypothetical protein
MNNLVDSLGARIGHASHERLVDAAMEALRGRDWSVESEPRAGQMRPDIVAHSAEGATYVFEVKSKAPKAFLGAVAQVEAQVESYRREHGADAMGVLLFAGDAPDGLGDVAHNAGIELVQLQSDRPSAVAKSLSKLLERPAGAMPSSDPTGQAPA